MKNIVFVYACFLFTGLFAQESNVFLDRNFWKQNPDIETIDNFIAKGHDISSLNSNAFDAVTYALIEKVDNATIRYLLSKDGNGVNKLTHDGRTYIFWSAYKNNQEMVEHLLDNGARMDIVDSHGYSPMNFAANTGQTDRALYELLIQNGANPATEKNHSGANALLLIAPFLDDFELVNYFKSLGVDPYSTDDTGNGLFNYAAKGGNIPFLKQLIDQGYPYQQVNTARGNAFIFASQGRRGHTNSIGVYRYLESLGLEPNVVGKDSKNPLHYLAYRGKDEDVLQFFLDKGVDVNLQDADGNTPFMNAVRGNDLQMIKLLQPYVNSINLKNNNGHSALTYAFSRNSVETVEFLLKHQADITVLDKNGNSLAYYVLNTFNNAEEFESKLAILQTHQIPLNAKQGDGNTLLHEAVKSENLDLIKRVMQFDIPINAKNNDGITALHLAAMKAKDYEVLKYLIEMGADKSIKTDFEESVYDLASENEILIQNNTDLEFLK